MGWKVLGNHPSGKVAMSVVSREGKKYGKLSSGSVRVAWTCRAKEKGCQSCRDGVKAGRSGTLLSRLGDPKSEARKAAYSTPVLQEGWRLPLPTSLLSSCSPESKDKLGRLGHLKTGAARPSWRIYKFRAGGG